MTAQDRCKPKATGGLVNAGTERYGLLIRFALRARFVLEKKIGRRASVALREGLFSAPRDRSRLYAPPFLTQVPELGEVLMNRLSRHLIWCGVLILIAPAVTGATALAQVDFGARVALTSSSFGQDEYDTKTGISMTAMMEYRLTDHLALMPELGYAQRGARLESFALSTATDGMGNLLLSRLRIEQGVRIDYLEFRLPMVLRLPIDRSLVPRIYVGPNLGLALGCRGSASVTEELASASTGGVLESTGNSAASGGCGDIVQVAGLGAGGLPLFPQPADFDAGILFGAGMDIRLGSGAITGDIRYSLGLSDVYDTPQGGLRNRSLELALGYKR